MPKVKTSKLSRLNPFTNSSLAIKLFGLSLILLMVLAVGYGAYMLIKENSSEAAQKSRTWGYNSPGIKHETGRLMKKPNLGLLAKDEPSRPLWYGKAALLLPLQQQKYIWRGPNVKLASNKQYLGCFYYQTDGTWPRNRILLDVYNSVNKKTLNKFWVNKNHTDSESFGLITYNKGKLARTCLAFYVAGKNRIELRVKALEGGVGIRSTKITQISQKKKTLSNMKILRTRDNSTILHGFRYDP